jgi:hypothetical protein
MQGQATLILCDICDKAVPDQAAKEVLYQAGKLRYRLELCPSCLDSEMRRHESHRGIPGFRKRAAIIFPLTSEDDIPRRERAATTTTA